MWVRGSAAGDGARGFDDLNDIGLRGGTEGSRLGGVSFLSFNDAVSESTYSHK